MREYLRPVGGTLLALTLMLCGGAALAQPDFAPWTPGGWGDSVIANSTTSATLPTTLIGDGLSHFYMGYGNFTGTASAPGLDVAFFRDEHQVWTSAPDYVLNGLVGVSFSFNNYIVPGGRHTMWLVNDVADEQIETNETNNHYARQWVWEPPFHDDDVSLQRSAPPERTVGAAYIPMGTTFYNNVDGLRFGPTFGEWRVAAVSSLNGSDYDMHLFAPSTGPEDGFAAPQATSGFVGGTTDFVLINDAVFGYQEHDVGLVRWSGDGDCIADLRDAHITVAMENAPWMRSFDENQVVDIFAFLIRPGETGRNVVDVSNLPVGQPMSLLLYSPTMGVGNRSSSVAAATVDADGRAIIDFDMSVSGTWACVLVRDASEGTDAFTYDLDIRPTPADIATATLPGSHGPVVPQIGSPITQGDPVTAPAMLEGDETTTNLYLHLVNNGPVDASGWHLAALIDGQVASSIEPGTMPGNTSAIANLIYGSFLFPGGRHTAGISYDHFDVLDEVYEDNNRHAEQWVWEPTQLMMGESVLRAAPPEPGGGLDDIPVGITRYVNSDGLRTPEYAPDVGTDDGYWGAYAMVPAGTADLDLGAFVASTGAQDGFASPVETSTAGGNATEFILFDMDEVFGAGTSFDMGVTRFSGEADYYAHATESVFLHNDPIGTDYGPYTLGSGELLALAEFGDDFGEGTDRTFTIQLVNLSGDADLALAVFTRDDPTGMFNRFEAIASTNVGDAGENELLELMLPSNDGVYYALAVIKTDADEATKESTFRVRFLGATISGVEESLPTAASLAAYPNPFNPQTTLSFSQVRDGRSSLQIFDAQGRLVRTLSDGVRSAGTHETVWNGRDASGRTVASGVYLARFIHPDGVERKRMVLMK